jgi:hypothetical protein
MSHALKPDRQWFVYTLSDPRDGAIRYVGWTVDIERRLHLHIWHSTRRYERHRYKAKWIRSLTSKGLAPLISTVESGYGDDWKEAEPRWIAKLKADGYKLTNLTDGGEGTPGIIVKESTRKLISANGKGKGLWRKGVEAAALANKGRKLSPEQVAKVVAANTGKKRSPEFCAMITERNRGRKASPETRALLSRIRTGRTFSEETKRKFSEAQFKRWESARAALQSGEQPPWVGLKRTPEQIARIRDGAILGKAKKRAERCAS